MQDIICEFILLITIALTIHDLTKYVDSKILYLLDQIHTFKVQL